MLRIHCISCGRNEPVDEHGRGETIRMTEYVEEGYDGSTRKGAHCSRCRREIASSYYGIPPTGTDPRLLEREALIGPPAMPDHLERELRRHPMSPWTTAIALVLVVSWSLGLALWYGEDEN